MTVLNHKRFIYWSLNFAFVSWGIIFLIGLVHGIYRAEIQNTFWLKIIFLVVNLLHLIALFLLFSALYNTIAFILRLSSANKRVRARIEQLNSAGQKITPELSASIRREEMRRESSPGLLSKTKILRFIRDDG